MSKISYIIPLCKFSEADYADRVLNINFALDNFLAKQVNVEVEAVLVEQTLDGKEHFLADITAKSGVTTIHNLVSYPKFNKGWLCNIGYNLSSAEHICIADSDMFINNPNYFENLLNYVHKTNLPWCIGWNNCYYLQRTAKSNLLHGSAYAKGNSVRVKRGGSEGGIVCFKKDFYKAIGGMNEWMPGLGGMDNDIAMRAHWLSNKYAPFNHNIGHLYHAFSPMKNDVGRKSNSRLYRYICARPKQCIRFMADQQMGDLSGPLCTKLPFMGNMGVSRVANVKPNDAMEKKAAIAHMQAQAKQQTPIATGTVSTGFIGMQHKLIFRK